MVVAKKTTAKAAKTTTKSSTAKKTTATKASTSTAKKTTVAKPVVKKSAEISVTGNKKIDTLKKEFNKKFPYLQLAIGYSYTRTSVAKGETLTQIPGDKTLASVRRADSGGDISIAGNKKIKTLEKEFDTVFGLYVQVCYYSPEGKGYYTGSSADEMTLSAFNDQCEKRGCPKDIWK